MNESIFHICPRADWREARRIGRYGGSDDDLRDGFIHFSTADQVVESAAKHRRGQSGLVLLAVDAAALGPALRWEPSRNGTLFPHLYGPLPCSAVRAEIPLPLGHEGRHVFPDDLDPGRPR